jgi:hypothetical protein
MDPDVVLCQASIGAEGTEHGAPRRVDRCSRHQNGPYAWSSTRVEICRRCPDGLEPVASYLRNHALYATFEPFRQGTREFALISRDYEATAVLDLATGEVIAEETEAQRGFCPRPIARPAPRCHRRARRVSPAVIVGHGRACETALSS